MKIYSKIKGTGSYLPERIVTNKELEEKVDTSDEWIQKRTGIKRRHIIAENQATSDLGVLAAKRAIDAANLTNKDIDLIIVASCSSEKVFPSIACIIQEKLQIPECGAFDIQAACSGFIYALTVADKFIASGSVKNALIIGTEAMSRVLNWNDRTTCVLFGDGAGAVVLSASKEPGIIATSIKSNGNYKDLLYLNNSLFSDDPYLGMQGNSVFKLAVKYLEEVVVDILKDNKMDVSDIDWLVPHQANIRIIQATAKKLNLSMDKVVLTVAEHANTSAASLPLALDTAIRNNKIKKGQKLLFDVFGGGLTWGAAIVKI